MGLQQEFKADLDDFCLVFCFALFCGDQVVLNNATQETDNPDLRDRAYVYWRLLSTDPEVCHLTGKSAILLHMLYFWFQVLLTTVATKGWKMFANSLVRVQDHYCTAMTLFFYTTWVYILRIFIIMILVGYGYLKIFIFLIFFGSIYLGKMVLTQNNNILIP